ncbi:MAG: ParB/RepB/Spo0J family partition protein [Bacteroidales bacterium]|nr:ParB/RepB/Spo0J family partition protein [Bacteroidales bacterium]
MANKGMGLGRGLGALISDAEEDRIIEQKALVNEINISDIVANPWQPRSDFDEEQLNELAESIKQCGIITPLTLRQLNDGKYQIVSGERRFRASKIAGLNTVPAYIREVNDDDMLQYALIENIQRSDLNPLEEAISYQRLMDECNLTQEQLAEKVSKKRSTVTNFLRLLKLPAEIQAGLKEKLISMGHARALVSVDDPQTQIMLYQQTLEFGYSVRRVEELAREYNEPSSPTEEKTKTKSKKTPSSTGVYETMRTNLSKLFGTSVKFERKEDTGKGKITIPFASDEELERILSVLDQQNK